MGVQEFSAIANHCWIRAGQAALKFETPILRFT